MREFQGISYSQEHLNSETTQPFKVMWVFLGIIRMNLFN